MKAEIKGNLVVAPDAREITLDNITRLCWGMTLDEFIQAARRNENGEFDYLMKKEGESA